MLEAVLKDIAGFGARYAPSACIVAGGAVLLSGLVMLYLKKGFVLSAEIEASVSGKNCVKKLLWIFFLVAYIYIVIGITILSRSESGTRGASFELFRTFRNTFSARKQIYENVLMFVPYAVLLYGLAKPFRRWWIALLMGAGSSLLIEVTQWVTRTGYFEVDDILTNTVGMVLGYLICFGLEKLKNKIKNRHKCTVS